MFVGLKMLKDFVTVTPDTLVKDAQKMIEASKLWMLLVVDGDDLVGYVRKEDLCAAMPSVVNSLDKHELNYLMSQLTISEVVREDIRTVTPQTDIEAAADMMYEMNLAGLAVIDDHGKLIGYINRSSMLEVLVEEMGYREGGSRITIETEDRFGVLYEVAGIIANMKYSIISTSTFFHGPRRIIVVRVATEDPTEINNVLKERGYKLVGPEDLLEV